MKKDGTIVLKIGFNFSHSVVEPVPGFKVKSVTIGELQMKKFLSMARALHTEENGAAFIEYTVLLGVILAVTIGTITAVGTWANSQWTLLPP